MRNDYPSNAKQKRASLVKATENMKKAVQKRKHRDEEEFEVESIISHYVRDDETIYTVSWVGYPGEVTEVSEQDLKNCRELLQEYKSKLDNSGVQTAVLINANDVTICPSEEGKVKSLGAEHQGGHSLGLCSGKETDDSAYTRTTNKVDGNASPMSPTRETNDSANTRNTNNVDENASSMSPAKDTDESANCHNRNKLDENASSVSLTKEENDIANISNQNNVDGNGSSVSLTKGTNEIVNIGNKNKVDGNGLHKSLNKRAQKSRRVIVPDSQLGFTNGCIVDTYKGFSTNYTEPVVLVSYKDPLPLGFESKYDEIVPIRLIAQSDPQRLITHLVELLSGGQRKVAT